MTDGQRAAFWAHIKQVGECWEWDAALFHNGYGQFQRVRLYGKWESRAHRIAWILKNGPVPDELQILHTCDNRKCCHSLHLYPGTPQKNSQDMVDRDRQTDGANTPRGGKHYRAKLTTEQVQVIRGAVELGCPQVALAKQFGISPQAVNRIVKNQTWK